MKLPKPALTLPKKKPTLPSHLASTLKALLMPPGFVVALAIPTVAALMYWTLGLGNTQGPLTYAAYAISAYAVTILATFVVLQDPVGQTNKLLHRSRRLGRLVDSQVHRASIGAHISLLIDLFWAALNFVMGALHGSFWFITLASYYLLLFVMRLILVRHVRQHDLSNNLREELRAYRACGTLLVMSIIALSGIIILVVHDEGGFAYPGILIYAIAFYVFYALVSSIINFTKFRKHKSPALAATMGINLAVALVSIFSLEVAMVSAFGAADGEHARLAMTIASGAFISIAVAILGIYMVVQATVALRKTTSPIPNTHPSGGSINDRKHRPSQ